MRKASTVRLRTYASAILTVATITAIGVAAYRVTDTQATQTIPVIPSLIPISLVVSRLNASLTATYGYLHGITPANQTTVGYQMPGQRFEIVLPVTAANVEYSDASTTSERTAYDAMSRTLPQIKAYLLHQGFTSLNQRSGLLSAVYFYHRSDALCQVTVYTNLAVTCAPLAQLSAIAAQARLLVDAYTHIVPNAGMDIIAAPAVRASKTAGYTIATMAVYNNRGETNVNFYTTGSKAWQVVNLGWYNDPHESGDVMPNCADFESVVSVRQAFAGQACYDSMTRTVREIRG